MHRLLPLVVATAVAAPSALAQGPTMQMNAVTLLNQKSVQKELKLTDEQVKKADDAFKKQMKGRQEARDLEAEERTKRIEELHKESEKLAADILKPEQATRFRQIFLQQLGVQAFHRPEVAKELQITEEQKQQVEDLQKEARKQLAGLRQPGGDRAKIYKTVSDLNRSTTEKATALLTPEQKAKWKKLTGELFTAKSASAPRTASKRESPEVLSHHEGHKEHKGRERSFLCAFCVLRGFTLPKRVPWSCKPYDCSSPNKTSTRASPGSWPKTLRSRR